VRRRAVFVMPEGERPHPRRSHWRRGGLHDAADDVAIGEHVEIEISPLADEREAAARLRTSRSVMSATRLRRERSKTAGDLRSDYRIAGDA
jgi:hypothetical protein